jgi:riboflavin kinase/FMN adenylyltransferase
LPTKDALLAHAGADVLVVLPPTPQVLGLTAEAFWQILRDDVRPAHIVEGPSFAFGKSRGGTVQRLRDWSAGTAIQVHVVQPLAVPLLNMNLAPVSSSLIRWLLAYGRARDAAICLGRPYAIEGQVVPGHQRGRTIGMPTVNLRCDDQLIPADGVYAGRCTVDGRTWPAAISIGTMPTFGSNARQLEAHLIGFSGDLYGRTLQLELLDWLRDQWKYPTVAALKSQLSRDLTATSSRANLDPSHPIAVASRHE